VEACPGREYPTRAKGHCIPLQILYFQKVQSVQRDGFLASIPAKHHPGLSQQVCKFLLLLSEEEDDHSLPMQLLSRRIPARGPGPGNPSDQERKK
jgi:hypothetical protein